MATQPKSFAEKKAAKASTEPKFQLEVSGNLGPFKQGEFLTLDKHLAEYGRLMLDAGREPGEETKLTDAQIIAGIKHVNVEGMSPDDADMERTTYLEGLEGKGVHDDDVPFVDSVVVGGVAIDAVARDAMAMGAKADAKVMEAITITVDGKRDWNGGPVVLEGELERCLGKEGMKSFPPIGTRRQGVKGDTVPDGMSPEQWQKANSPVEFYKYDDMVHGKKTGRFTAHWYAGTAKGRPLAVYINQLKAVVDTEKAILPGTPDHIAKLKADGVEAQSLLETAQGEWNDAINRIALAIKLWQKKNDIAERLPKVGVNFVGVQYKEDGTAYGMENAAKRRKPITLKDKSNPNPEAWTTTKPYTLGSFFRMDVNKALKAGGTVLALVNSVPERKKKLPGSSGTAASPTITAIPDNVEKFESAVNGIASYLGEKGDGKINIIKARLGKADGGDEFAYALVLLYDYLKEEVKVENYRVQADAFLTRKNVAEGERKQAEANQALAALQEKKVTAALGKVA